MRFLICRISIVTAASQRRNEPAISLESIIGLKLQLNQSRNLPGLELYLSMELLAVFNDIKSVCSSSCREGDLF